MEEQEEIASIFTDRYYELTYLNGINYASHLILELFQKTGILELLRNKYTSSDEIIKELNFIPKAEYALEWMLSFLTQGGFLKKAEDKDDKGYYYDWGGDIEPEVFLAKGTELDKKIIPTSSLMAYVISEYPNFFKGSKSGLEILFAGEKIKLWNEYFSNDNSGYSVHNSLGAFGVTKWVLSNGNIRLLELGAGTGGATASLIDRLKARQTLSKINEYIFSDISPIFLRIGNRVIMSRVGDDFQYSLKRLNFERPLIEQGINKDGVDIIYAVNALHVAKDLVGALKNIYEVVKPGGALIFSEHCRPSENYLLFQEFIFILLDNYVDVNLDRNLRPIPGFLDYEHWRCNLEAAGFKNIEAVFNTDGKHSAGSKTKADILAAVIKGEKE